MSQSPLSQPTEQTVEVTIDPDRTSAGGSAGSTGYSLSPAYMTWGRANADAPEIWLAFLGVRSDFLARQDIEADLMILAQLWHHTGFSSLSRIPIPAATPVREGALAQPAVDAERQGYTLLMATHNEQTRVFVRGLDWQTDSDKGLYLYEQDQVATLANWAGSPSQECTTAIHLMIGAIHDMWKAMCFYQKNQPVDLAKRILQEIIIILEKSKQTAKQWGHFVFHLVYIAPDSTCLELDIGAESMAFAGPEKVRWEESGSLSPGPNHASLNWRLRERQCPSYGIWVLGTGCFTEKKVQKFTRKMSGDLVQAILKGESSYLSMLSNRLNRGQMAVAVRMPTESIPQAVSGDLQPSPDSLPLPSGSAKGPHVA